MHILFLTDNFPPELNAPAIRTFEHAKYWVKQGHKITVITCAPNFPDGKVYSGYKNKWQQRETMDGINVIRVKTFIAPNKGFLLRIIDYMSFMLMAFITGLLQKIDIVIATSPQFFTAIGGWMLSVCKRKPFVFELRDLWPESIVAVGALKNKLTIKALKKMELFLYRHSTAIIAVTDSFKKNLITRGINKDKIFVVLNGVDSHNTRTNKKNNELIKKYSLENKFVIGYIGTHGMAHALENILHAAKLLNNENDIKFIFVGAGAEREKLIALAEKNHLDNVLFIPQQPQNKINLFWGLCDLALVHLKNHRTFSTVIPSKIFTAISMEIPVILSTPKGEASKLVEKESIGIWVNAENPDLLKSSIVKMRNDHESLTTYIKNCRSTAIKYSREKFAHKLLTILTASVRKK